MPTVFVSQNEDIGKSNLFDGGDEVNDLNILRLMAKKSYIISCYEVVVEATKYSGIRTPTDPTSGTAGNVNDLEKSKC